jgi:polyphosphate glucokinase
MHTLTVDCGGGAFKAGVVEGDGALVGEAIRRETPYPLPPDAFVDALVEIASSLPSFSRATVGMPGMIRRGVVVHTPHYITEAGPRTAVVPALAKEWAGFDATSALADRLGVRTLVLNDAEVHGYGVIVGRGLEVVLTLGTGLGSAIFSDGVLAPHLELSHAPSVTGEIWDRYIGQTARTTLGDEAWSARVLLMLEALRPMILWDRLYLGGGGSHCLTASALAALPSDVAVVPNSSALAGGANAWQIIDTTAGRHEAVGQRRGSL